MQHILTHLTTVLPAKTLVESVLQELEKKKAATP